MRVYNYSFIFLCIEILRNIDIIYLLKLKIIQYLNRFFIYIKLILDIVNLYCIVDFIRLQYYFFLKIILRYNKMLVFIMVKMIFFNFDLIFVVMKFEILKIVV